MLERLDPPLKASTRIRFSIQLPACDDLHVVRTRIVSIHSTTQQILDCDMLKIRKCKDAAAVFSMLLPASDAGPGAVWRMGGGGGESQRRRQGAGKWRREATAGPSSSTFYTNMGRWS